MLSITDYQLSDNGVNNNRILLEAYFHPRKRPKKYEDTDREANSPRGIQDPLFWEEDSWRKAFSTGALNCDLLGTLAHLSYQLLSIRTYRS